MKLINCPVCGTRCSADTEKCPECGFEIKEYFSDKKQPQPKKKNVSALIAGIALLVFVIVLVISLTAQKKIGNLKHTEPTESLDELFPSSESATVTSSTNTTDSSGINVSGVYSGDDHEILVLNSDGLAYYYCVSIEFTELQCPWYVKDGNVYIDFSRLHCTVEAKVDDKELLFKSDSANWNTELFTRLDVSPKQYLTKKLSTHDKNATLNYDGTLSYTLDGITYTLPKSFIDLEDDFDTMENTSAFIDQDVQHNYLSSIVFQKLSGKSLDEESSKDAITTFVSSFYNDITVSDCTATKVAGHNGYISEIGGYLNKGFSRLENYEINGFVVVFYNEKTSNDNFIMMVQSSNRDIDNTDIFGEILRAAY